MPLRRYLIAAIELVRDMFREAGAEMPHVRLSVGWPGVRGGLKQLGSCWKREVSSDGAFQIFVSPVIEDTIPALGALLHELCHACTDCQGHSHEFKVLARGIGLDGKLTATYPGETLIDRLNALVVDKLGKYPHAALTPEKSGEKEAGHAHGQMRVSRIWLHCPDNASVARQIRSADLAAQQAADEC